MDLPCLHYRRSNPCSQFLVNKMELRGKVPHHYSWGECTASPDAEFPLTASRLRPSPTQTVFALSPLRIAAMAKLSLSSSGSLRTIPLTPSTTSGTLTSCSPRLQSHSRACHTRHPATHRWRLTKMSNHSRQPPSQVRSRCMARTSLTYLFRLLRSSSRSMRLRRSSCSKCSV